MPKRFTDQQLRQLRNEVPFPALLAKLRWPHKRREGQFVFVCPRCGESRSDLNPQENLVRCFACETNFNPIDFTIARAALRLRGGCRVPAQLRRVGQRRITISGDTQRAATHRPFFMRPPRKSTRSFDSLKKAQRTRVNRHQCKTTSDNLAADGKLSCRIKTDCLAMRLTQGASHA